MRREDCESDRRGQLAVLTDRGMQALADAAPGHVAAVREHMLDRLTPAQIEQLTTITGAIVAGLEES